MRKLLVVAAGVATVASSATFAQEPRLAPEGRVLPPKPAERPATFGGVAPAHPFEPDPSGGFSRVIFETDEDPNFKLVIRDFSFPPDGQPHRITLPSAAFVHFLGEPGEISISKQRWASTPAARKAVPAGAPIDVVNNGAYPVVVRALIVE